MQNERPASEVIVNEQQNKLKESGKPWLMEEQELMEMLIQQTNKQTIKNKDDQ